jgi:Glutaminase
MGDHSVNFWLQSVGKRINYLLALEEHGAPTVHRNAGCEPSGVRFNEAVPQRQGHPPQPDDHLATADPVNTREFYLQCCSIEIGARGDRGGPASRHIKEGRPQCPPTPVLPP